MLAYVINLDRSSERLDAFAATADRAGVAFERVRAIDGQTLSRAEQDAVLEDPASPYRLSAGEIACFLSHRLAWQTFLDTGARHAAIFEDDVQLSPAAGACLEAAADWMPADADQVKLETCWESVALDRAARAGPDGRVLRRIHSLHHGCGGYILTRQTAETLIAASQSFSVAVDHFQFDPRSPMFGRLVTYQLDPALCVQAHVVMGNAAPGYMRSVLTPQRRAARPRGLAKLRRELSRPLSRRLLRAMRYGNPLRQRRMLFRMVDFR